MAILKMTAIVAAIKGKISGTIFQTSPAGQVARKYRGATSAVKVGIGKKLGNAQWDCCRQSNVPIIPTVSEAATNPSIIGYLFPDGTRNPVLEYPTQQSIISQLSTRWRNLDPAQAASWSTGAINFPFKNKFGETYTGSGYAVYQSVNSSLINAMLPVVDNCPIPAEVVAPTIVVDWSNPRKAAIMLVEFPDGIPAGVIVEFWSTPLRSAGRNSNLNQTLIASFTDNAAFNVPLIYAFNQKFGAPVANGKLKTVFGGRSATTNQQITIAANDTIFDSAATSPLVSLSDYGAVKEPLDFVTGIALGNVPALSDISEFFYLWGTQLFDNWSLTLSGADAGNIDMFFNGEPDAGGVINGGCDVYGNMEGFVLQLDIDTGALGAHTATVTLDCPNIPLTKACVITWTSV